MPKGVMVVQTTPADGREDEYNDWYTNTHVPELMETPGFVRARRFRAVDGDHYLAIYEIDADEITAPIDAWRARSAAGKSTPPVAVSEDRPPVVTVYELVSEA